MIWLDELASRREGMRTSERELVFALILFSVRNRCSSQQTQPDRSSFDSVTIFAVVQESHSVPELGNVAESMSNGFEFRSIPSSVAMNRSLSETELILERTVGIVR